MNKTAYVRFFAACSIPAILLTVTVMLPAGAATFTVSNNNDSGAGSFRQAILDVNAQTTGDHRIGFSGGLILGPLTGLPVLTYTGGRVTIHGNESTLDGRSLWNTEPGLRTSATTTIKYLTINNFPSHGLYITGSDCVVIGCRMYNNGGAGLYAQDAYNLTVGAPGEDDDNRIGSNNDHGIYVVQCENITMQNNYVGFGVVLDRVSSNSGGGVFIVVSAGGTIGGANSGEGNYFCGNNGYGLRLEISSGIVVLGNYCGVAPDGSTPMGNSEYGIFLQRATDCVVGGTGPGEGNLLSGNNYGLCIRDKDSTGNQVLGNHIGADSTGTAAIPNALAGILIENASGNTIGGSSAGARNVVSGNTGPGIILQYTPCSDNTIQGNYIGVNTTGSSPLPNTGDGIVLSSGTSGTLIGGLGAGTRNVISGNTGRGIFVNGSNANTITGNRIGVDTSGTIAIPNGSNGVHIIASQECSIGGVLVGEGNIISGNGGDGIYMASSADNDIFFNYIGTDVAGVSAIPNENNGITFETISTTDVGGLIAPNIISGNNQFGLLLSSCSGVTIRGNKIGTTANGSTALPNGMDGVRAVNNDSLTIGGPGHVNIISGNAGDGIALFGCEESTIQGNRIGTAPDTKSGTMGNGGVGVRIQGAPTGSLIGGLFGHDEYNVIAGNGGPGIWIIGSNEQAIQQNSIYGNGGDGIALEDGANNDISAPFINSPVMGETPWVTVSLPYSGVSITIDLFADDEDEGQFYLASLTSDTGMYYFYHDFSLYMGKNLTATATDAGGNTSQFSAPVLIPYNLTLERTAPAQYVPGQELDITLTLDYTGASPMTSLAILEASTMDNWAFKGIVGGTTPGTIPELDSAAPFPFSWTLENMPTFPVTFTYRVFVNYWQTGDIDYTGYAGYRTENHPDEMVIDSEVTLIADDPPVMTASMTVPESYAPGGFVDITASLDYDTGQGALSSITWLHEPPAGWIFVGMQSGTFPSTGPAFGQEGPFTFVYGDASSLSFPTAFTYRVQAPAGGTDSVSYSGYAAFHVEGLLPEYYTNTVVHTISSQALAHPADLNADFNLVLSEAIAYLTGWQQGSNPIAYAIRAAYLWQNGETYIYNSEAAAPLCWELQAK